ncbi:RecX family transcriptional regulator [Pedobacter yulinensis]|uniref:Regulatory protein RecX n=1 Tax=Pedobacter yulinensis TaxID=2126353 RepID=A0A2T3HJJ5_9SPHI|nr:regulatory protein RecX [Pedobacter yulinensis]PST82563.1 RecX family transcriptional regulator [Pedobacter yulinensis]
MEQKRVIYDLKTGLAKAEAYCAYQERSQQEVRDKLYSWGLHSREVEQAIATLIETNFLNEARFAAAYVSGKFRIKKWGRQKIRQGLKLKRVPDQMIARALKTIDGDAYLETIVALAEKKLPLLGTADPFKRKYKLLTYLQGRGFESDVILDALKNSGLLEK